jgi:hypothetical protein
MRNLWGQCCRGTWVAALLYNAMDMVRVVGVQQMGFSDLWCRFVVGVVVGEKDGCVAVVVGVIGGGPLTSTPSLG